MTYKTKLAAVAIALMASVGVVHAASAPSQQEWDKIVAEAKKEGEVIVWGQAGDQRRRFWKDAFEKANPGITVRLFQPNTSSDRDTRYLRERDAKVAQVDVLVTGGGSLGSRVKPAGGLQPLRPMLREDVLDGSHWVNNALSWFDNEKEYVAVSDLSPAITAVVGTSVGQNDLTKWQDLLDPKFDRKIGSLDPRAAGMAFSQSLFMYDSPELGPDFVQKLYAGGRVIFAAEERQLLEWVDSGRISVALAIREPEVTALQKVGGNIRVVKTLAANGKQQALVTGVEGLFAVPNLDPLPHPNATRVYINWMLSKEGQQAMVDTLGLTSTRTDVDMSKLSPLLQRAEGVEYINMSQERFANPELAKNMRDAVTRAIDGR